MIHDLPDHFPLLPGKFGCEECLLKSMKGLAPLTVFRICLSQIREAGTQRLSMLFCDGNQASQRVDLHRARVFGIGGSGKQEESSFVLSLSRNEAAGLFKSLIGETLLNESPDKNLLGAPVMTICME